MTGEVVGQSVDIVGEVFPRARNPLDLRLSTKFALGADLPSYTGDFFRKLVELIDHRVDNSPYLGKLAPQGPAVDLGRHLLRQIPFGDGQDHAFRFVNGLS